jgi:hypothetical protein
MSYDEQFCQEYLNKVRRFAEKKWVIDYFETQKRPNFWTILEYREYTRQDNKKTAYEIRMSKMLRWLLDPNENHKLGNVFVHELVQLVNQRNNKDGYELSYNLSREENGKVLVTNEEQNIDVLYKDHFQKLYLAIELKQYAKEGIDEDGVSQLVRYADTVKDLIATKDSEIQQAYIFLTPLGEKPSEKAMEQWVAVSYKDIVGIIDDVIDNHLLKSNDKFREDTLKIILDFKADLLRVCMVFNNKDEYVEKKFGEEKDKAFTFLLVQELVNEKDTEYMDKLATLDQGETSNLRDLILLIREYLSIQNKKPNTGIQVLTRMIYNSISDGFDLELYSDKNYSPIDRK